MLAPQLASATVALSLLAPPASEDTEPPSCDSIRACLEGYSDEARGDRYRSNSLIRGIDLALTELRDPSFDERDHTENLRDLTSRCIPASELDLPSGLRIELLQGCEGLLDAHLRRYPQTPETYNERLRTVQARREELENPEPDVVAPPVEDDPPPPPPPPTSPPSPDRNHLPLLGSGVALGAASIAMVITGDQLGRSAYRRIEAEAAESGLTGSICDPKRADRLDSCDELSGPRALLITGAIGIAAGAALTVTALVLRRRKASKRSPGELAIAPVGPRRSFGAHLSLRF